jgi:hypothetical protein
MMIVRVKNNFDDTLIKKFYTTTGIRQFPPNNPLPLLFHGNSIEHFIKNAIIIKIKKGADTKKMER